MQSLANPFQTSSHGQPNKKEALVLVWAPTCYCCRLVFFFFFIFIKSQYQYVTNIGHLLDLIRLVLTVCAEIFLL